MIDMIALDKSACRSKLGANAFAYYLYMGGEWEPNWRSSLRGAFMGLSFSHGIGDMVRSMYVGISFALKENYRAMLENSDIGSAVTIKLCGGGGKSIIWPQILNDVLQVEIEVSVDTDLEPLGAVILTSSEDIKPQIEYRKFKPDAHNSKEYELFYDDFIRKREQLYVS